MNSRRTMPKHWPKFRAVLVVALCGILVFSLFQLYSIWGQTEATKHEYANLSALARTPTSSRNITGAVIDFSALADINPDVVGWITLPETSLDYPVVQAADNEKYLQTTFSGQQSTAGSIFMDCSTPTDLTCKNTIIYGNRMNDGSMFGILNKFKVQSFYDKNPVFYLTIGKVRFACEIFSAYATPAESASYQKSFKDDAKFSRFIKTLTELSLVQTEVQVQAKDTIVTLSTFAEWNIFSRMVVHARVVPASQ